MLNRSSNVTYVSQSIINNRNHSITLLDDGIRPSSFCAREIFNALAKDLNIASIS